MYHYIMIGFACLWWGRSAQDCCICTLGNGSTSFGGNSYFFKRTCREIPGKESSLNGLLVRFTLYFFNE